MGIIGLCMGTFLPNTYNKGFVMGWLFEGITFILWELIDLYATKIKLKKLRKLEKELNELLEEENKNMENNEEIEIDEIGVEMQRREEILKSEHFVDIRVVVGEDYENPVTQANLKANPLMVASALVCLRQTEKELLKRSPELKLLVDMFEKRTSTRSIEVEEED